MSDKEESNMLINEVKELHASILEISKSSFEIKKLCITTIGIFNGFFLSKLNFTSSAKITDSNIIITSILATLLITILFHLTDATTYFFQRKNRERQSKFKKLLSIEHNPELFNLSKTNWMVSLFNSSMIMYIIIYLMALLILTYLTNSPKTMILSASMFFLYSFSSLVISKKKRKYS